MSDRTPLVLLICAALLTIGTGCNKDDDAVGSGDGIVLTSDDAADVFASSLAGSASTAGLTAQMEEAAAIAGGGSIGKVSATAGTLWDTTIVRQRTGTFAYAYTFRYSINLVTANRLAFSYTMKGTYDTPRMASSDSATASFEVTNILTGAAYSVSGLYNRDGSQTSKVRNKSSFKSRITVSMTGVLIDKSTTRVSGGTATLSMFGETGIGSIYGFTATVTFMGNQQATMVINGKTYAVNLATGEATAV